MSTNFNAQIRRVFLGLLLGSLVLTLWLGNTSSPVVARAQRVGTPEVGKYYTLNNLRLPNGTFLDEHIINGPPVPPAGFEVQRRAVTLPNRNGLNSANSLTVPAFNWVFGCSSVSGAMIAGYYDRNGYPNMYVGPTNGGVTPLDNSVWGTWSDGYSTYPNIPLAASHNGVDGRVIKGSIDDYWVQYGSTASDPYITGAWTQHTWSDAIGDYMKTSQSAYSNSDGSTTFYGYTGSPTQLTCADMVTYGIDSVDGTYGRKLFYEARGYTVTDCYSQATDNNVAGGFSFAQYKAEIDAGHPVMLNLEGHTIVGVGYDDATNTVYIHDTWDYLNHSMTWGTSYSGMALLSVSIVNLATQTTPTATGTPTLTRTPTITRTTTLTLTVTSTITITPTITLTPTGTSTVTKTPTFALTATLTRTATHTATPTGTATLTATPTATLNQVITLTSTSTATGTATRTPTSGTLTLKSVGAYDGWVLESTSTSNRGGSINAAATTFQLGDDVQNRQYKAILSFGNPNLPANAVITSAKLRIRVSGSPVGTNPFTVLGNLLVDIKTISFGKIALETTDFQAAATLLKAGTFGRTPASGWYSAPLTAAGLGKINRAGATQFRLYFAKGDNANSTADYLKFFSGNSATYKPELIITYKVP